VNWILFALLATVQAQWLNFPTPGTPHTRDGKPNLSAPAPRANGKPDLSGVWHVQATSVAEMQRIFGANVNTVEVPGMQIGSISKYAVNILLDFKPEDSPMRPAAGAILAKRRPSDNPSERCLPIGVPAVGLLSEPIKIVQSPRMTVILYESDGTYRQIYADGRSLPKEIAQPAWLGYSIGKWERDTFVVESTGFNDRGWLDLMGHPRSESLRMVERLRRRDFGHLDVEMSFDDPPLYSKPFSIRFTLELLPESDIFEYFCGENEKDRAHAGK
jgi:hypothetical protein